MRRLARQCLPLSGASQPTTGETDVIIDVHVHFGNERDYVKILLDAMDEAGIDMSCLSPLPPHFEAPGHDAVMDAAERHPERIIPFGYIQLGVDKPELADELHRRGFKGLKMHVPRANYDDRSFYPVYARAEELGMPILFHTGIIVLRTDNDARFDVNSSRMRPIFLDGVSRAFPKLNMIAAHIGLPWHDEAALVAKINPNVYVDLALGRGDGLVDYGPNFFRRMFHWKGAFRKIVFGGSHYSHAGWILERRYKDIFRALGVDEETQAAVLGGTVAKMLRLSQ